jgi:peptidoglycan hydrolase-like protein with peptidoglycan-binding domain
MRNVEGRARMKAAAFALVFLFSAIVSAQADPQIAAAQQALKDQGFYYGEITGRKDADTTAAIRRYQIRNGLQITGDLSTETRKSLRITGGAPAATATPAAPAPPAATPARRATPPPDTSDLRADESAEDDELAPEAEERGDRYPSERGYPSPRQPQPGYDSAPGDLGEDASDVFADTPYEIAPPELQRQVLIGAQTRLARQGYYRAIIDGIYGPAMESALSAYQLRMGLEETGTLDMETLASLGLLPGPHQRGGMGPSRRIVRPPVILAPNGERVYVPR